MLRARAANPQALRRAVREVLYRPSFRREAARMSELLARAPGAPRAAELMERLARHRRRAAGSGGGRAMSSTTLDPAADAPTGDELFARRGGTGDVPRRPRLLSYVGRWGRAAAGCRPPPGGSSTSAAPPGTRWPRSRRPDRPTA